MHMRINLHIRPAGCLLCVSLSMHDCHVACSSLHTCGPVLVHIHVGHVVHNTLCPSGSEDVIHSLQERVPCVKLVSIIEQTAATEEKSADPAVHVLAGQAHHL